MCVGLLCKLVFGCRLLEGTAKITNLPEIEGRRVLHETDRVPNNTSKSMGRKMIEEGLKMLRRENNPFVIVN